jgi:hypothetical protein
LPALDVAEPIVAHLIATDLVVAVSHFPPVHSKRFPGKEFSRIGKGKLCKKSFRRVGVRKVPRGR